MKRFLTSAATLLLLSCIVPAQIVPWYLRGQDTDKKKVESPTNVQTVPENQAPEPEAPAKPAESWHDTWQVKFSETTSICMLLPFTKESGTTDVNVVDFYSGALLAAKHLGEEGRRISITAIDSNKEYTDDVLDNAEVTIGPISKGGIEKILLKHPYARTLVSPLDPGTEVTADSTRLIHVPASAASRAGELAEWAAEGIHEGVRIAVVSDVWEKQNPALSLTLATLDTLGIRYVRLTDCRSVGKTFKEDENIRIIAVSDSDWFLREIIRSTSELGLAKYNVSLYTASRVKNFENLDVELLHNSNLHICPVYFVDYSDPAVKRFLMEYRAMFQCEPNSFAFHGYDVLKYFATACRMYGNAWPERLQELSAEGLQSGFRFRTDISNGRINTAVRRIIYNRDFSISIDQRPGIGNGFRSY